MQSLEATYVEKFKCDGKACDAQCCRKWAIDIDDKTMSKYKHIKPAANAKEIVKHIKKKKMLGKNPKNIVQLTKDRTCPFLGEDLLCKIQKTYGADYLSLTCSTYPRHHMKISDDLMLRSLSLTCPVACHLVLNHERPIKFHAIDIHNLNSNLQDYSSVPKIEMMPLFSMTSANILHAQNLSIDERLALLILFAESAQEAKNLEDLAKISESFEKAVIPAAKELFEPLKFNPRNFLKELFDFTNALFKGAGAKAEVRLYNKFINDTFELMPIYSDERTIDLDKIESLYHERFLPAKKVLLKDYSLQVENYLLHQFLLSGLPFACTIPHFTGAIAKFILEYKIAEFTFVCFLNCLKDKFHEVGIELAAGDFTNAFEHNITVHHAIDDRFMKEKEAMPIIQLFLDV